MLNIRATALALSLALAVSGQTPPKQTTSASEQDQLRAQVLMDRWGFSTGEIDGKWGKRSSATLRAWQEAMGVPLTGELDQASLDRMNQDQSPTLVTYTIEEADVAGPFEAVPSDMMEQAKLERLAYATPEEALAEKFHCSPDLLKKLNGGTLNLQAGAQIQIPNVGQPLTSKAARIEVYGADNSVRAYDDQDKLIAYYPATSGSRYDPLPIGEWKITGVARNPPFHYNPKLFWDAKATHSKAKIAPGPNNPVGVAWIDLTKEHYGIHGTPEPSKIGYTQSHGCIRLTNWDVAELADMVQPGTPVLIKR